MEKTANFFRSMGFVDAELNEILNAFAMKEFQKNEHFVESGKTSRHIGFVEYGMLQYYIHKDGTEKTTYVSIENTFVASVSSFINQQPARENIKALIRSGVALISRNELKRLASTIPAFKEFYLGLLETTMCAIDDTRHDLLVLSAEQRYEKMLQQEPHLLQVIPLQHLASMLGITPRHLSRIRGSYSAK